ncbi:unnamed protein product, partial [marine sediment metagenome]
KLQRINVNGNNLTTLPPEIGNLTQLEYLFVTNNKLTSLPPEIGGLVSLKELYLFDNQLSSLPPEIGNCTNLKHLNINRNNLTSLPPEIGNLQVLVELYLDNNLLETIPPEIGNLSEYLGGLQLDNNQLTSLPYELMQLTKLCYYDAGECFSFCNNNICDDFVDTARSDMLLWMQGYIFDWIYCQDCGNVLTKETLSSNSFTLEVYPNPFTNSVTLSIGGNKPENRKLKEGIRIYNM